MIGGLVVLVVMLVVAPGDEQSPGVDDRAAYEAARKAARSDAGAHVRLALWCESRGMTAERMKHLAAAVLNDPSNAVARGLLGLVSYHGKWEPPDDVSREARDDPRQKAFLAEYLQRRAKAADKADDQWKLATWCEQNGLKEQAAAHWHAVVRLDPRRDAAWVHLGFRKVGGRWVKPEWQAAAKREADEQERANKRWRPLLERWRSGLSSRDKARRADAEAALAEVTDPRAAPMVWAVFVPRGAEGQKVAVRVLGQIDSPGSSRALTMLALRSSHADVRGTAVQILRQRDPRDFATLLIGLLRDKVQYEVRSVNGPGSRGELLIKNKDVNVDRRYSPPDAPFVPFLPGDSVMQDASGLPVINRFLGNEAIPIQISGNSVAAATSMFGLNAPAQPAHIFDNMGLAPSVAGKLNALAGTAKAPVVVNRSGSGPFVSVTATASYSDWMQIPIGQMMLEAQRAAQAAEMQLQGDVQAIRAYNVSVEESNQRVLGVLAGATGLDLGADRTGWERWITDLHGYAYRSGSRSSSEPPTVVEEVPLAYQPQPVPFTSQRTLNGVAINISSHGACFGAGTPVRALEGLRPIETLCAGDLVLTQSPRRGELKYQAVVEVYHNPPNATYRIALDTAETIVATGIHRLWKAGKGWAMARELKPGDVLRTLGGAATVKSVETDRTQPVFNLRVADGESYFVGTSGVLAHDNSTVNPVPEPFDAVAPLTSASAPVSSSPRPRSMLGR